jgi:hypothetical protein
MSCVARGQSHCDHFEVGACIIHTFPRWLVDATNVMSSPFGCNRTFISRISQVRKRVMATIPSFFCFSHTQKFGIAPRTNSEVGHDQQHCR